MALAWKASGIKPTRVRISHSPQSKNKQVSCVMINKNFMGKKLTITIPAIGISNTGGDRIIVSLANNLSQRGHVVNLIYIGGSNPIWYQVSKKVNVTHVPFLFKKRTAKERLNSLISQINKVAFILPESDIFLATWVFTVMPCMANTDRGKTVFLAQANEVYKLKQRVEQVAKAMSHMAYMLNIPIVTPSSYLKGKIKTEFNNKAIVIPPYVDQKIYRPLSKKKNKKIKLLFVGNFLNKNKGFDILVRACKKLKNLDFELHIATQHKNNDKLNIPAIFHKPRNEKELAKIYNSCDLSIHLSEEEGFGLTLLESMACGNICLSTRTGGNKDFAVNNKNCLLIDRDVLSVVMNIKKVISDIDFYHKLLSVNAVKTAGEYSEKRMIDGFEKLFLRIAN